MDRWFGLLFLPVLLGIAPMNAHSQESLAISVGPARWHVYGEGARPDESNASWGWYARFSRQAAGSHFYQALALGYVHQRDVRPGILAANLDLGASVALTQSRRRPARVEVYGGIGVQRFDATNFEAIMDWCNRTPICFAEGPGGWQSGTRVVLTAGAALEVPIVAPFFGRTFAEIRNRLGSSRGGPEQRVLPTIGVGLGARIP